MKEHAPYFELVFLKTPESIFTFKKFELLHDAILYRASLMKTYLVLCVIFLLTITGCFFLQIPLLPWFLLGAFGLYSLYYLYQYKRGYLSDYKLAEKTFSLTEEQREKRTKEMTVQFYMDHAYIGSFNENRMFHYKELEFIQRVENIVIFYFYPSKETHMKEFSEFVVNLQGIPEEKKEQFLHLVSLIERQYSVPNLSERTTLL